MTNPDYRVEPLTEYQRAAVKGYVACIAALFYLAGVGSCLVLWLVFGQGA
jgi:hypothetical protein